METCVQCHDHIASYCSDCRGEWVDRALRAERLLAQMVRHIRYLELKLEDNGLRFYGLEVGDLEQLVA